MHGAERVAVVDIDVHHGNGTQALFRADPTTFYASTHQVSSSCSYLCFSAMKGVHEWCSFLASLRSIWFTTFLFTSRFAVLLLALVSLRSD